MVTLQIFEKYPTGYCLADELDVSDYTEEQISEIIAHNSTNKKWCRIKPTKATE